MNRTNPTLGVAMTLTGSALFAINGTVAKLVLQAGIDAPRLTTLRATGAFAGMLILSLAVRPGWRRLAVTRRDLPVLIGYGVTGFFAVPLLYFVAISRLPVGIALLFEYTAPLFVALWARFGQRQPVRPRLWGGLALSMAGLACVAEIWGDFHLDRIGVLAGFFAALGLAGYYLLGARGVRHRDAISLNTWAYFFAAALGLSTRALIDWTGWWPAGSAGGGGWSALGRTSDGIPVWLLCCYVVALGSIVPYLLVAGALRHLPATSVGIIGMVEPVLAATVAWLTLGEALNRAQLTGGLLVLLGVGLAETARIAAPAPPPVRPRRSTPLPSSIFPGR